MISYDHSRHESTWSLFSTNIKPRHRETTKWGNSISFTDSQHGSINMCSPLKVSAWLQSEEHEEDIPLPTHNKHLLWRSQYHCDYLTLALDPSNQFLGLKSSGQSKSIRTWQTRSLYFNAAGWIIIETKTDSTYKCVSMSAKQNQSAFPT